VQVGAGSVATMSVAWSKGGTAAKCGTQRATRPTKINRSVLKFD
jgi:hypothetical protein